jgi:hypothetical protein
MTGRGDIAPGTIVNGKVSKGAGIEVAKLEKGSEGQIPVVQANGLQAYKTLSGDGSINSDGVLTVQDSEISYSELKEAIEGQILVAQSDGKFAAKTLSGDVTLTANGSTTSNEGEGFNDHKYTRTITWGTTDLPHVTFGGDAAIVTHGLKTSFVAVSLIDVSGAVSEVGANGFVDLDAMLTILSVDDNTIKIGIASGASVSAGNVFKLTIIG